MWWIGFAAMVVLIPINLLFHRHSAEQVGLVPDGPSARPAPRTAPVKAVATIRDAVRAPVFWLLALSVTMIGLCNMIVVVHQTRMLVDMGYSLPLASLIFGMLGVMRATGGLVWGPFPTGSAARPASSSSAASASSDWGMGIEDIDAPLFVEGYHHEWIPQGGMLDHYY